MYQLTESGMLIRLSDGALIPQVDGNKDYCEYLEWVGEGNTPKPYIPEPEPIQIPKSVTMRQARIALSKRSLLTTVQSAIQNSNDEVLKIEWEYATEIKRDWPTLKAIATLLSFTESQLDELFLEASQL